MEVLISTIAIVFIFVVPASVTRYLIKRAPLGLPAIRIFSAVEVALFLIYGMLNGMTTPTNIGFVGFVGYVLGYAAVIALFYLIALALNKWIMGERHHKD